jgi:hypothetical protein
MAQCRPEVRFPGLPGWLTCIGDQCKSLGRIVLNNWIAEGNSELQENQLPSKLLYDHLQGAYSHAYKTVVYRSGNASAMEKQFNY